MRNFVHPLETESRNLPIFNKAIKTLSGIAADIASENFCLSTANRRYFPVTEELFPRLYRIYRKALDILEFKTEFPMFISNEYKIKASTSGGSDSYVITISSGAVDRLDDNELAALIGRELGHIGCGHMQYRQLFSAIKKMAGIGGKIGKAAASGMLSALISWNKASEFTADRAGAIAAGSAKAVIGLIAAQNGTKEKSKYISFDPYRDIASDEIPQNIGFIGGIVFLEMMEEISCQYGIIRTDELKKWASSSECKTDYPQIYYRYLSHLKAETFQCGSDSERLCHMHCSADSGSSEAAHSLGMAYLTGKKGLPENPAVGLEYIKSAALGNGKGAFHAIYAIGLFYRDGTYGIKKNLNSAWHLINYSADACGRSASETLKGFTYGGTAVSQTAFERICGKAEVIQDIEENLRRQLWISKSEKIYCGGSIGKYIAAICRSGIFRREEANLPLFIPWDYIMENHLSAEYYSGADFLYAGKLRIYPMEPDNASVSKTAVKIKLGLTTK